MRFAFPSLALLVGLASAGEAHAQVKLTKIGNEEVWQLGASKKGDLFAYATWSEDYANEHNCSLSVIIQDLTTDKRVWSAGNSWGKYSASEKDDCPDGFDGAWSRYKTQTLAEFAKRGIVRTSAAELHPLPVRGNGEDLSVTFADRDLTATSPSRGSKVIASLEETTCGGTYGVEGWLAAPGGTRVLLLVVEKGDNEPCPLLQFIGCHLTAGFKPAPPP
jgi:hypothetical protein